MYSSTILCLCFCVFSESSGGFMVSNRLNRGLSMSEYARSGTSYTVDSNAYDGIPAEHRSSRPRTCNCSHRSVCPRVTGYRPSPSTCCQVQTSRRTMPPWPTHRTSFPSYTTCQTQRLCTTCRTLPSCTTRRTLPPCTRCRTLPPCTRCQTLPQCTTRRTLPPCMKCQTTRLYPSPMLVLHVELPERPCYTSIPSDTPPTRGDGGYEKIAWSDNTSPSAIINNCHPFGTTRRPCRQPTKCPCTSMIPIMQPCNCKMHD